MLRGARVGRRTLSFWWGMHRGIRGVQAPTFVAPICGESPSHLKTAASADEASSPLLSECQGSHVKQFNPEVIASCA